ncbi:MAG: amidohydrolase 2 [Phycisphaerales bacterium]|nr:amidohydrolase 2 [Phycisphaerales bacterium]
MLPRHARYSRRSFVSAAIATAAGALARPAGATPASSAAPSTVPATAPTSRPVGGPFVDFHTHVGQTWNTTEDLSAANLLKWMDAHDVARAVVLPLVSPESSSFPLSTRFVLEQVAAHRDRLIPFCCIDPRTTINGGKKGVDDMLARYVDLGCRGFGEHKPGLPIDDPLSTRLYAAAGRHKLPVLFHLDAIRNTDKPGLPGLEAVLKAHPETTFVGHGPGFWASISGDVATPAELGVYSKKRVTPGGALDRLLGAYPNLYADLSAGSGAGALSRDPAFATAFLIRRQDRLLFGTDYLAPGQPVPQFDVLKSLDVPDAVRAKVYRENARRLLGL